MINTFLSNFLLVAQAQTNGLVARGRAGVQLGWVLLLACVLALPALDAPAAPLACDPSAASCVATPPPVLIPPSSPPPGSCGPAVGGSPSCAGGSGPASLGNNSATEQGAGNPLNLITGNKYQQEVDMPALPGVLGLELVRHYNSMYSSPNVGQGQFGRGWKLSYETRLYPGAHTLQIAQADGTRVTFNRDPAQPSLCSSDNPAQGRLLIRHFNDSHPRHLGYLWQWPNGRELMFDARGLLMSIRAPSGETLHLLYDPDGFLLRVTDPQNRALHLIYSGRESTHADATHTRFEGVQSIKSPVGRFEYRYGSPPVPGSTEPAGLRAANLVAVQAPGHTPEHPRVRHYHYEDPRFATLLTGLSVQSPPGPAPAAQPALQRLASWGYDANARANLSVKGWPAQLQTGADGQPLSPARLVPGTGIEQVTLQRYPHGVTVLTNSLGQSTTYRHAIVGTEWRLLESRGAGCATCGPANMRYAYDDAARLTHQTQLSAAGRPLATQHTTLDTQGRPVRVERIPYDAGGRAGPPQWLVRYEYPDLSPTEPARTPHQQDPDQAPSRALPHHQPSLIARPSVVPGQEWQTRIQYNALGQPTEITETGFSPVNEQGQLQPTPIQRSTRYTWREIEGRSVLTQIDGPLPNGPLGTPLDSDITTLQWSRHGDFVTSMVSPGGQVSQLEYEPGTGMIKEVRQAQGVSTRYTYDRRARQVSLTTTAPGWVKPFIEVLRYDEQGRLTGQESHSGIDAKAQDRGADRYNPTRMAYGVDLAGRLQWQASARGAWRQNRYDTESRLIESTQHLGAQTQTQRYEFNDLGQLIRMEAANGAATTLHYSPSSALNGITDSLGRYKSLRYASGLTRSKWPSQTDDFGRLVLMRSPDSGVSTRQFDAADRLIASTDAQGNHARYAHDLMGRILRQTVTDATGHESSTTQWRYQGGRLIELLHPNQSERYRYDERGLQVQKTTSIQTPNGLAVSVTRYGHDSQGRLQSSSLPDGSVLIYGRNFQGQIVSVVRQRVQTPWLQWLLPAQPLAHKVRRDLMGLSSYQTGNRIEAQYHRSSQGALAQLLYRRGQATADRAPRVPGSPKAGQRQSALDGLGRFASFGLGIGDARAQPAPALPGALQPTTTAAQPGALGLPSDPQALLDFRYLWDTQGNLLYQQERQAGRTRHHSQAYDGRDRLIVSVQAEPAGAAVQLRTYRYLYDAGDRRLLAQEPQGTEPFTRRADFAEGSHQWLQQGNVQATYNRNGQPDQIGQRQYRWDALGRLTTVLQDNAILAHYTYNHRGERTGKAIAGQHTSFVHEKGQLLAELDAQGRITRQYIYLGNVALALIDSPKGQAPAAQNSAMSRIVRDLHTLAKIWLGLEDSRLVWLHTNHLGAPMAATDASGQVLWQAQYAPFGSAQTTSATGFELQLRLPGQYADAETGLHYNRHRYYDPAQGQYLSPDPLGMPNGPNGYAYVRFNPLRYIDPEGLVLFAFDGTENSNPVLKPESDTISNVVAFQKRYLSDSGRTRYISGVGTVDISDPDRPILAPNHDILLLPRPDKGFNWSGPERIERMVEYLQTEATLFEEDDVAMNVDIVGFSRGAAQARDFANRIAGSTVDGLYRYEDPNTGSALCQKLNFRFLGLWDTVLSQNSSGYSYQLGIPPAFRYVAQAVALNEFRGRTLSSLRPNPTDLDSLGAFPLESILGDVVPETQIRLEKGFLGSHADIGGGFKENDLSLVALAWMVEQAQLAGVTMDKEPIEVIPNPVLHDKSDHIQTSQPVKTFLYQTDDREVRYLDGRTTTQRMMVVDGMSYADTTEYIRFTDRNQLPRSDRPDRETDITTNITGTVNLPGYLEWLHCHRYGLNLLQIQCPSKATTCLPAQPPPCPPQSD
jgi:RHS repeat-associated protein